ncbi:MAG TPA: antitoxin MazE family protein [Bacillota bacterium]|nr:antitoxin MazE family protein [Bacillota bacterium]
MGSVNKRVAGHRKRLRQAGLRPVQIWVPDTRRPGFADECRRQSQGLQGDPQEKEVQSFIDAVSDWRDR